MSEMSTAAKVRARIKLYEAEVRRLQDFLRQLEEFEAEEPAAPFRAVRFSQAAVGLSPSLRHRFVGVKLIDAAVMLIGESPKRQLGTREITEGLLAGGFEHESKNFYNTVHALLHRESKKDKPRLRRDGKLWKLV